MLGAGAIGAPIGALLHERGDPVVLVARGEHGRALATRGLDLRLPVGSRTLRPPVVGSLAEAEPTEADLVLISVMGQHTLEALAGLDTNVPVASFQNGTAPLDAIARRGNPLIAAMVFIPSERRAPGVVALTGTPHPGAVFLGPWPPASTATAWTQALAAGLNDVGFPADVESDIGPWIRAKLLMNLAGIALALCDEPVPDVISAATAEAEAVWRAADLRFHTPAELLARIGPMESFAVDGIPRVGGSSRHALARGQALETRSLHGPIVELGARFGVPTPVNAALIALAERAAADGWAPGGLDAAELRKGAL